jgi:uncharacterized membrane protein YccC
VDGDALRSAARAALVMPAVFAFAYEVIGRPQTSVFAAFGCFAMLVLVEFGGRPLTRLLAYLGLGAVGAVFIVIGTLCSRSPALAATATAVVGFVTLFAGAFSGYLAAGTTAATLLFILPVTIAAPNGAISDRLLGWAIAAVTCTAAALFLWPPRRRADLRRQAAVAVRAVAGLLEARDSLEAERRGRGARDSVDALGRMSLGSQHRPAGPTSSTAALAALPDELDWLLSLLVPTSELPYLAVNREDADAANAAVAVLQACADRLDGGDARPDLDALDASRLTAARALMARLPDLPERPDDEATLRELEPAFRTRLVSAATRQVAGYAMRATSLDPDPPGARDAIIATEQLAREHATPRSLWFRNSVRGAAALAIAVYIADRSGLQHGFWVVLGALSVLRSNALGTGRTIVAALAGTAVGIVAGALLVVAIGTHHPVLWAVLPFAVLGGAYAPRAISFAAGQAAFTVVLFVLFNLIQPVGWRVGVVRVEDVAIGFAISLGVGVLFWPRGAAALVRSELASAFVTGADYVAETMQHVIGGRETRAMTIAGRAADGALHRLDDAFRQYLTERTATVLKIEDVAALVGSAARLRRSAESLRALGAMVDVDTSPLASCGANLEPELHAMHAWYVSLGRAIEENRAVAPPHLRDVEGRRRMLQCVRAAAQRGDRPTLHAALLLVWAAEHLENLRRLEAHVAARTQTQGATASQRSPLARLGLAS